MTEEAFEKLKQLQNENAELGDKLSFLKTLHGQIRPFPSRSQLTQNANDKEKIEDDIKSVSKQVQDLKNQLISIEKQKIAIQKELSARTLECNKLVAKQDKEKELVSEFYAKILEKCSQIEGFDVESLKSQIDLCRAKRKKTFELREEQNKLNRLITFQQSQQDAASGRPPVLKPPNNRGRDFAYDHNDLPHASFIIDKNQTFSAVMNRPQRRFSTFARTVTTFNFDDK